MGVGDDGLVNLNASHEFRGWVQMTAELVCRYGAGVEAVVGDCRSEANWAMGVGDDGLDVGRVHW